MSDIKEVARRHSDEKAGKYKKELAIFEDDFNHALQIKKDGEYEVGKRIDLQTFSFRISPEGRFHITPYDFRVPTKDVLDEIAKRNNSRLYYQGDDSEVLRAFDFFDNNHRSFLVSGHAFESATSDDLLDELGYSHAIFCNANPELLDLVDEIYDAGRDEYEKKRA